MVLDADSLLLAPRAAEVIAAADGAGLPGTLKSELFASALELTTDICESAEEAAEALAELRQRGGGDRRGARPEGGRGRQSPSQQARGAGDRRRRPLHGVRGVRGHLGTTAGRERAARPRRHAEPGSVLPGPRRRAPWLPVVLAVSANSPYLAGEETGMLSNRAEILAQLPRSGAPPAFRSYEDWEEFVELFATARDGGGLHALLVGHSAASALRDAGDPHA